ncbi:MAG: hypothetical protein SFW67_25980 [Myxococcaceae bacterium]|nr:hypothetical protein [Myxococcaceae bacterium]
MMKHRYGSPSEAEDFGRMVYSMPDSEFQKPDRSTIPLLCFWKAEANRNWLLSGMGLGESDDSTATFEYAVESGCSECGGKGKSSFTDLLLVSNRFAVAVEAKYLERPYQRVAEWLSGGKNAENRKRVLRHWLHLIRNRTGHEVQLQAVDAVVYQMVHRTASACSVATPRHDVAHLVFGEVHDYRELITKLADIVDPNRRIRFWLVSAKASAGPGMGPTEEALADEQDPCERAALLREAILADPPLYSFLPGTVEELGR